MVLTVAVEQMLKGEPSTRHVLVEVREGDTLAPEQRYGVPGLFVLTRSDEGDSAPWRLERQRASLLWLDGPQASWTLNLAEASLRGNAGARRLASTSAKMRPLKVGVVGAGAVGTYFGVRLAELGHDVRFLVRKRHDAPERLGVTSWQGDFVLEHPTIVRDASELGDDLDWVLVGLKSTALEQENVLRDLLEPCVSGTTRVQLLMNGLGAEEKAAEIVDARRVHGGLVYGGLSRRGFDVNHAGVPCAIHGGSFVDDEAELAAAERLWTPVDREKPKGAVAYVPQPCLLLAQWSKLAWNVPFNGCTVLAAGADVGALWRDAAGREAAVAVMREVCRAANADLAARGSEASLDEEAVVARLSAVTDDMAEVNYVPSTTKDFREGRRMEVEAIFGEPLRRARAHGVATPRLEAMAALLRVANDRVAPS